MCDSSDFITTGLFQFFTTHKFYNIFNDNIIKFDRSFSIFYDLSFFDNHPFDIQSN